MPDHTSEYHRFLASKVNLRLRHRGRKNQPSTETAPARTVPYRAILKKRKAIGIELSHSYFIDGANYCKCAENEINTSTLFDLAEADA